VRFEQFDKGDAGPTASSAQHAQKFPLCGNYLINWMNPAILERKVSRRWSAFVKWCGSKNRAIEACTWGKGPLVQINSQMVGRANGKYKGGQYPEMVFIHGKVADKYESGTGWVIWEATVLHELVHWARLKEGIKDQGVEPGQEFEMEAYGEHIELTTPFRVGP
jgi:Metallopeptidase toxin 3